MIIALNNKSNLNKNEFNEYQSKLSTIITDNKMILCPTFLNIANFNLDNIHLGSQNVSATSNGAYTGEISAGQLKTFNVEYSIIGHSERRTYQKESLEEINQKMKMLLKNEITPILCIGETMAQREEGKVKEVIKKELTSAIISLTEEDIEKIIVAYEPIWSIGTGIIPTNDQIEEVFKIIKEILPKNKILYGGSANEKNIEILNNCKCIDGYLLGGISLKLDNLQEFLNKLKNR